MDGSPQAAVTPEGVRDGDPAVLAALVARRGPAVLAFCDAVCDTPDVADAVAEAFARFRALVSALGDLGDADPDTYLLGATRHAAAAMARVPSDGRGMLRVLGRGSSPETYAAVPGLLAARADSMLGAEDLERLSRLLEKSAACREVEAAFRRAERGYRSPPARPLSMDRTALVISAMRAAAPLAPEFADDPEPAPPALRATAPVAEEPPADDPPAPGTPVEEPPAPETPAEVPPAPEPPVQEAPDGSAVEVARPEPPSDADAADPDDDPDPDAALPGSETGGSAAASDEDVDATAADRDRRPSWRGRRGRSVAPDPGGARDALTGPGLDADGDAPTTAVPSVEPARAVSGQDDTRAPEAGAEAAGAGDHGDHDVVVPADDPALDALVAADADADASPTRVYRARRGLPARGAPGRGVPRRSPGGGISLPRHEPAGTDDPSAAAADHGPVFRLLLPAVAIVVAILVMLAIAGVFGGGDPAPASVMSLPVATQVHPDAGLPATTEAAAATTTATTARPATTTAKATATTTAPATGRATTAPAATPPPATAAPAARAPAATARTQAATSPARSGANTARTSSGAAKSAAVTSAVEKATAGSALPGGSSTGAAGDDGYQPATTTNAAPPAATTTDPAPATP